MSSPKTTTSDKNVKTNNISTNTTEQKDFSGKNDKFITSILNYTAQQGDELNAKMAQKTLENAEKVGIDEAMKQMAKDCFTHPTEGYKMSYSEMRSRYG